MPYERCEHCSTPPPFTPALCLAPPLRTTYPHPSGFFDAPNGVTHDFGAHTDPIGHFKGQTGPANSLSASSRSSRHHPQLLPTYVHCRCCIAGGATPKLLCLRGAPTRRVSINVRNSGTSDVGVRTPYLLIYERYGHSNHRPLRTCGVTSKMPHEPTLALLLFLPPKQHPPAAREPQESDRRRQ